MILNEATSLTATPGSTLLDTTTQVPNGMDRTTGDSRGTDGTTIWTTIFTTMNGSTTATTIDTFTTEMFNTTEGITTEGTTTKMMMQESVQTTIDIEVRSEP